MFIILPRNPKFDVCNTCTRLHTGIKAAPAENPIHVASLELTLEKHQVEADRKKAMLKQAEEDRPMRLAKTLLSVLYAQVNDFSIFFLFNYYYK